MFRPCFGLALFWVIWLSSHHSNWELHGTHWELSVWLDFLSLFSSLKLKIEFEWEWWKPEIRKCCFLFLKLKLSGNSVKWKTSLSPQLLYCPITTWSLSNLFFSVTSPSSFFFFSFTQSSPSLFCVALEREQDQRSEASPASRHTDLEIELSPGRIFYFFLFLSFFLFCFFSSSRWVFALSFFSRFFFLFFLSFFVLHSGFFS